jgi:hypothetical protein
MKKVSNIGNGWDITALIAMLGVCWLMVFKPIKINRAMDLARIIE